MAARSSMAFITLPTMLLLLAMTITQAASSSDRGDTMPASEDLVEEACKNLTEGNILGNKMRFDKKTCILNFRSNNRSAMAKDYGDLVVIALDLLSLRTSEVAVKAGQVLSGSSAPQNWTELSLRYCAADYGVILNTLPVCRDIFLDLKPRGKKAEHHDAMLALDCVDRLGMAARDCYIWLSSHAHGYEQTHVFEDVLMHTGQTWGLMEIALNYFDDDDSSW